MNYFSKKVFFFLSILFVCYNSQQAFANQKTDSLPVKIQFLEALNSGNSWTDLPLVTERNTLNSKVSIFQNTFYKVIIQEIDRGNFIEINGELESLSGENSSLTLRISFPQNGKIWQWHRGLGKSETMKAGSFYFDTVSIATVLPPDGAFNGNSLKEGGYGDRVGRGSMSFYPLSAVSVDGKGKSL
jgi:hypothetical protein